MSIQLLSTIKRSHIQFQNSWSHLLNALDEVGNVKNLRADVTRIFSQNSDMHDIKKHLVDSNELAEAVIKI